MTDGAVTLDTRPGRRNRTPHIELRIATVADVEEIADLLGELFRLSRWSGPLSYDRDKAAGFLKLGIERGVEPFILAREPGGELVGAISWHLDARLTQPIGVLDEVFVIPRLMKSDLGLKLIDRMLEVAKLNGAKVFNFPICSGMPEQRS